MNKEDEKTLFHVLDFNHFDLYSKKMKPKYQMKLKNIIQNY